MLDDRLILKPSDNPVIHEDVKFLIENLCNNSQTEIDWVHRAILYKYTHMNDSKVPAVLFKGAG